MGRMNAYPTFRQPVYATHGMVATSQPLAAQVGLDVLKKGGNAVDAAVATIAALCVVEPCMTGIGGDAFALIWSAAEQKLYGINGSGGASMTFDADAVRAQGHTTMPTGGGATVTIPGSLRAWEMALARFGSWGLDRLLAPAIDYARQGYPVSPVISDVWGRSKEKMSQHPASRRVWVPNGRTPAAGDLFFNPEFAGTLMAIAEQGADAFYTGSIAQQIVTTVQADGGFLTMDDLANYRAEWIAPISADYTNHASETFTFYEIPPNGQGLTALIAIKIADQMGVREMGYGSADYHHCLIEATKLAFADASAYIADPRLAAVPVDGLLAADYISQRRTMIDMAHAQPFEAGRPNHDGDTVYLTVADSAGNMVSWIQSLYMGFGSGLTAGTTGVQLQNRGANFSLVRGHPNEAAPGKRPYHTIIPGFITKEGQAYSSFGVMGGFMQPQGHLQVGLNLVEFGMNPQTALDAPRTNWQAGLAVGLEPAIDKAVIEELGRRGHDVLTGLGAGQYGGGQIIVRHPDTGVLAGGTEPRKDGVAAGW